MAQLTDEQFDRILQAAESINQLREETGLDLSVLAVRGVQGYTVTISNPEDKAPPLILVKINTEDFRAQIGRYRTNDPEKAWESFRMQLRRQEWRKERREENGEQ